MDFNVNAIIPIESFFVNNLNAFIITADGKLTIRETINNQYYNGSGFQATPFLLSMTRVSDTNSPGWWSFDFDTDGFAANTYVFTVTDGNNNAANTPQTLTQRTVVPQTVDDIADAVWDEAKAGHGNAGSFGEEVQEHATSAELAAVEAKVDGIDSQLDTIESVAEIAAAAATGEVKYNPVTSKETLSKFDDTGVIIKTFDMKDSLGNPAEKRPFYEKKPL